MRRVGKGFSGRVTPLLPTMLTQKPRKPRKDTHVPQPSNPIESVADEAVHKELGDSLVRAATTASSLEAEQDSEVQCQETMGDTIAQTRIENVSKHSNDSLLARDEEEVAIDAIPLAVKSLSIVGWKIYKEGRKSYYQIMRAGGKSQTYMFFSQMLKSFDKEDLEDLYKLLKAKYESTRQWIDLICVIMGELELYLHVGGEEVSPCTTYTFNDVGKEA
ncbi:hypothetical protein Tco_0364903 [Tanacetum coccineum]